MSVTLTEFLLARIAEDEAKARAAGGQVWASLNRSWDSPDVRDIAAMSGQTERLFAVPMDYDEHVARHDPARVLAECEAKRRILELHPESPRYIYEQTMADPEPTEVYAGTDVPHELLWLALPYADHPDYDESWRP